MSANHNYRGDPNAVHDSRNTPITLALEKGDYIAAERLIGSTLDGHSLDSGPTKMIPLNFVLSSDSRPWHLQVYKQNLRLAKLLVERGANPNIRIPSSNWTGASRSPLELLVDMIQEANKWKYTDTDYSLTTIGLNNEVLGTSNYEEQLNELLDTFLVCGANPNVTTNNGNATVYHVALAQDKINVELVMKLCNYGGDLNQTNVHGTTAFMDLISHAPGDLAMDILKQMLQSQPNQKISSLLVQNCKNETALWRAMFAGSTEVAIELLKRGADGSVPAIINGLITGDRSSNLPPIFSPLLRDSYAYVKYMCVSSGNYHRREHAIDIPVMNKVMGNSISPVVDSEVGAKCFPDSVLLGLERLVSRRTRFRAADIKSSAVSTCDVPYLMFGRLKAGLQQMCVQTVMEQLLTRNRKKTQEDDVMRLNPARVARMVTSDLHLPAALVPIFNVEAARLQLGYALFKDGRFITLQCNRRCNDLFDDSEDELDDDYEDFDGSSDEDEISSFENWMELEDGEEDEGDEVVVNEDEAKADDDGWETISDESDDCCQSCDSGDVWGWPLHSAPESNDGDSDVDVNNSDSDVGWE